MALRLSLQWSKVRTRNVACGTGTKRTLMDAEVEKTTATEGHIKISTEHPALFNISIK